MRKIVGIIGVIVALALSMPCFAKNTQNVYIIKNQSIETVTKELQKSLTNSAVSNDVISRWYVLEDKWNRNKFTNLEIIKFLNEKINKN